LFAPFKIVVTLNTALELIALILQGLQAPKNKHTTNKLVWQGCCATNLLDCLKAGWFYGSEVSMHLALSLVKLMRPHL